MKVLKIYLARWEIEVFHRVLKSGCRVEKLQLKAEDRIKPALALYIIVAWRILYLMKLGRQCPELPCDWVFAEAEWKSLSSVVHGRDALGLKPTLGQMVTMVASFGGYMGRKGDGPPGPESLWKGLLAPAPLLTEALGQDKPRDSLAQMSNSRHFLSHPQFNLSA